MPNGWVSDGWVGEGSCALAAPETLPPDPFRRRPPSMVTKLGQKPFTQEKSLLHEDWLMARLRPSSVSSGSTERQFDLALQSPQPSQTRSLITARLAGSGYSLRLRRRRFSEAQVWS